MANHDGGFYVTDSKGTFYKLSESGNLIPTMDADDARVFSEAEVQKHIGTGRKAKMYNLISAYQEEDSFEEVYAAPDYDSVEKPTLFDGLNNDWEATLSRLCYMSSHMEEYQNNLSSKLSDIDKEICDIMHYLEFEELDDSELVKTSKMLQDRRRKRREIKDEMERTAVMRSTFLDKEFGIKVHESLQLMERMKTRIYTPRKLNSLFENQTHRA